MNPRNEIQIELNELNSKYPHSGMPPMQVPQGYFQNFSTSLLDKIKEEEEVGIFSKNLPYQLPNNYFDNLSTSIFESIHQDEFLNSLPKEIPYHVPANYFEEFPESVISGLKEKPTQILKVSVSNKWISKLALAATLFLFMGLAFKELIYTDNKLNHSAAVENELSNVSDSDIQLYLQQHAAEIDASLVLNSYEESNLDIKKLENEVLDQTLNKISDEELKQYTF